MRAAALLALVEHAALYLAFVVFFPIVWIVAVVFVLASLAFPTLNGRQMMPRAWWRILMLPSKAMREEKSPARTNPAGP